MSALNVLSKHFGGLPHLPLRLVMTDAVRAICAGGYYFAYEGNVQGGVVWTVVCLWTGVWTLPLCIMLYYLYALASSSMLGFGDANNETHTVFLSMLCLDPMSHSCTVVPS